MGPQNIHDLVKTPATCLGCAGCKGTCAALLDLTFLPETVLRLHKRAA